MALRCRYHIALIMCLFFVGRPPGYPSPPRYASDYDNPLTGTSNRAWKHFQTAKKNVAETTHSTRRNALHRILPVARAAWYQSRLLRTVAGAWGTVASLFTNESYRIYLIFFLWVSMGITWGIVDQGWDVITATHFAVSALATGGLTAPPVDANGILAANAALFCGFYCLFGIPLMALTLGIFARLLVEGYVVEEELAAISRPLSVSEREFASRSLCSRDAAIHLSDYVVLQLMRQGKLSVESFEFMKRQYQMLDERPFWLRSVGPD